MKKTSPNAPCPLRFVLHLRRVSLPFPSMQTYTCKRAMLSPIQTLFALLAAACLLTGCQSTPAKTTKEEPAIELLSDGSILFHGKSIEAADLPRKLKSRGYKPGEPVLITVPSDATTASLSQLSGSLASAGFRRPIFRKERHAAAYVNPIKK